MTLRQIAAWAIAAVAALLAVTATAQAGARNWITVVAATDGGHRIGNPNAPVKLTEYISYTCPHCAEFMRSGESPLELAYVAPGKVSVEIRHLLRDPADAVAAMLVSCAPPAKFLAIHKDLFARQNEWARPLVTATTAQSQRWRIPGVTGRRAVASDFKFYDLMERHGISRVETDRCLANQALAQKMAETSAREWKSTGDLGTPTFAINGLVLAGTAGWDTLGPQIAARF